MLVKSDWGGWLLLAPIIIFPSMLYLTQPLATHEPDRFVASVAEKNHPERAMPLQREPVVSQLSANVEPPENNTAQRLASEQDYISVKTSAVNDNDPETADSFFVLDKKDAPVTNRRAVRAFSGSSFVSNNLAQQQGRNAVDGAPAHASVSIGDETVVVAETTTVSDNAYLYLAETEPLLPVNENKCPPVYMELNSYAKNMRSAMGCVNL